MNLYEALNIEVNEEHKAYLRDNKTEYSVFSSEALVILDAKNCNPNGNIEDDNKPRLDYLSCKAIISEYRYKRYIRDMLFSFGFKIFISNDTKRAMLELAGVDVSKLTTDEVYEQAVSNLMDIKMFGGTLAISEDKKNKRKAFNGSIIGAVQVGQSVSMNKVELNLGNHSITTKSVEVDNSGDNKNGGNIGKKYKIKYGLFPVSISVDGETASKCKWTEDDYKIFDCVNTVAVTNQSRRSDSKKGQMNRLYLRVEANKPFVAFEDLTTYVSLNSDKEDSMIENISDCKVNVENLVKYLGKRRENIAKVVIFQHENLITTCNGEDVSLVKQLKDSGIDVLELNDTGIPI
jgi:Uncharacterized protein predicted to be involved in DNA repair